MSVGIEIRFGNGASINQQNTISDLKKFIKEGGVDKNVKKIPVSPLWIKFAFKESKKYPNFGPVKRIIIREIGAKNGI